MCVRLCECACAVMHKYSTCIHLCIWWVHMLSFTYTCTCSTAVGLFHAYQSLSTEWVGGVCEEVCVLGGQPIRTGRVMQHACVWE